MVYKIIEDGLDICPRCKIGLLDHRNNWSLYCICNHCKTIFIWEE